MKDKIIPSIHLHQALISNLKELVLANNNFWNEGYHRKNYDHYYQVKTDRQFDDKQMSELYPDLYDLAQSVESHSLKFSADRDRLTREIYAAKVLALKEIGVAYGCQAHNEIKQGAHFYDTVLIAYNQAQHVRQEQLDGIAIPFLSADGPLTNHFSKALGFKTPQLNKVMLSPVYAKICFDRSQADRIFNALEIHLIDFKHVILDDEDENNLTSCQIKFNHLKKNDFISIAGTLNITFSELIDENPYGKDPGNKPDPLEDQDINELKGLKASLYWELFDNRNSKSIADINAEINTINELIQSQSSDQAMMR